jgi:hypothetical protein
LCRPRPRRPPAPKVTINGLFDLVGSVSKNWANPDNDPTDSKDQGAYTRERGRFDITGEVGKSKAVWGIELDFSNGVGVTAPGNSSNFDLDTDLPGFAETKWLYVEVPFTGPSGAMIPLPFESTLRGGAQPATGHSYKNGLLWSGDFPGFNVSTRWAPNIRSTLTYAQIQERVFTTTANESYAILGSLEIEPFKGFSIKPTYTFASYDGGNPGTANLGMEPKNGFNPNGTDLRTTRHTFGAEARWTAGPVTLTPTFWLQLGDQEVNPALSGGKSEVDIRAWIADLEAGLRFGPLNLTGKLMYTPGMKANECVQDTAGACSGGDDINYYQAINPAFIVGAGGFTELHTSNIEYNNSFLAGAPGVGLRQSPSYDKYGRIFAALRADYALTPAYTLYGVVNAQWTDKKVDTDGTITAAGITNADGRGDARFLGTELMFGQIYRFAPSVALDTLFAYMFSGDAFNHRPVGAAGTEQAEDVYKLIARIRYTF